MNVYQVTSQETGKTYIVQAVSGMQAKMNLAKSLNLNANLLSAVLAS